MKTALKLCMIGLMITMSFNLQSQIVINDTLTHQGDTVYSAYLKVSPTLEMYDTIVTVKVYPFTSKEKYLLNNDYVTFFDKMIFMERFVYHRQTDGVDIMQFALDKLKIQLPIANPALEPENITIEDL